MRQSHIVLTRAVPYFNTHAACQFVQLAHCILYSSLNVVIDLPTTVKTKQQYLMKQVDFQKNVMQNMGVNELIYVPLHFVLCTQTIS